MLHSKLNNLLSFDAEFDLIIWDHVLQDSDPCEYVMAFFNRNWESIPYLIKFLSFFTCLFSVHF